MPPPETHGFTLIEMLLSLAVIGILAAISAPVLSRVQTKNDLNNATLTVVQTLRRAQILSQSVDSDTGWGVKAQSGSITLFKGTSYAARDQTYDDLFSVPGTITESGLTEIVMAKFTGYPVATGSMTLTSSVVQDTATVSVNARGLVNY